MDFFNYLISEKVFHNVIVVRWKFDDSNDYCRFMHCVSNLGFQFSENRYKILNITNKEYVMFYLQQSDAEKFCLSVDGTEVLNTLLSCNLLVDLNGVRLADANDFLKIVSNNDHDLMSHVLRKLISLEYPEWTDIFREEIAVIENGISKIIQNPEFKMFGSYPSPVRRNGYSDIDVAIEVNREKSCKVRPLPSLIENSKCLLDEPLTKREFYSFPPEEIIKSVYYCIVENEVFQKKFDMRLVLVRTPIVIFKSKKVPGMNISYDLSVNNRISVEKSKILDDVISRDTSKGNKMRYAMMFIVHWAKTKKLMGGVYPTEKLEKKTKFHSYVINQLIIHFIQVTANKDLIFPSKEVENRVSTFNFDELFASFHEFLRQFFSYFNSFDHNNVGIFGRHLIEKNSLAITNKVEISPMMVVDPMDPTHNVSGKVTDEAMVLFDTLVTEAYEKTTKTKFRIVDLL